MIGMVEDFEETVDPWWSWEPGQRKLAPAGGVKVLYIRGEQREDILSNMKSLLQRWNTTYEGEQVLLDPDQAFIGNWLWFSSAYPDVGDRWYLFVEGLCYVITNEGIEIQGHFPDKPSSFFGNGIFRYYQRADKPGLGTPQGFEGNVYYDIYQHKPIHLFAIDDESWQKPIRDLFPDEPVDGVVPVYMPNMKTFAFLVSIRENLKVSGYYKLAYKKGQRWETIPQTGFTRLLHIVWHDDRFYYISSKGDLFRIEKDGLDKMAEKMERFLYYEDCLYGVEYNWDGFIKLSMETQPMAKPEPNEAM